MHDDMLTFRQTCAYLHADFKRLVDWLGGGSLAHKMYWCLLPSFQAIFWYRISRWLYVQGWRNTARMVFLFKLYLTRVEIPPTTSIGPGLLIAHAAGVVVYGKLGARVTMYGGGGSGGGVTSGDIGGGPGYPVIGDDVTFGYEASVLGPVRIGDGVHLGPKTLTTSDVEPGGRVYPARSVIRGPRQQPSGPTETS
jgi:serine O-acetyltransferase